MVKKVDYSFPTLKRSINSTALADADSIMRSKDQEFTVGKCQQMWGGKAHYPDLVRLVVPKGQALAVAQKILRELEHAKSDQTHLGEIALFGHLEELDAE